tara:strand:+ start:88 stop:336 length:249 start_codon:yes stop_codon:yes gene_type:complete
MIDTDKYEGHTEDEETWSKYANWATARYLRDADEQLIADAPLLLEAYKRLRLVADELYLHIVGEPHMTLDELVAEMPWRNEE